MPEIKGTAFHGECVSADASGGVAFTLYLSPSQTAYTLRANQRLCITDVSVNFEGGGDYVICFNTDAAGKRVVGGNLAAKDHMNQNLATPHEGPFNVVPKLIATAGNIDAFIHGFIKDA